MKYNIYYKDKVCEHIFIYVKIVRYGYCNYTWRNVKNLNSEYYNKYGTKAFFNIFKAKSIIDATKYRHKQLCLEDNYEYWIKLVSD